jgi:hypothetical protein
MYLCYDLVRQVEQFCGSYLLTVYEMIYSSVGLWFSLDHDDIIKYYSLEY